MGGLSDLEEYFLSPLEADILRGQCRVAVDIGANKGQWSHWLSRHFDHVVAVEPDIRIIDQLRVTLPENVHLLHAACSDTDGVVDLYMRELPDQTSTLPFHPIGAGNQADAPVIDKIAVNAVTMDGILSTVRRRFGCEQIDFVKLDIEGAEHIAMAGATPDLFRATRWLVEIHDNRAAVGEAIRRLGHEDIRLIRHPFPKAHPEHMWVLFNAPAT